LGLPSAVLLPPELDPSWVAMVLADAGFVPSSPPPSVESTQALYLMNRYHA